MRTLGHRSHRELAEAIGVSRGTVSLWLEGKVGVPRPVAILLRLLAGAQRRSFTDGSPYWPHLHRAPV